MIGLILLAVSFVLLRLEGKSLRSIGLDKPAQRSREFLVGLLAAALVVVVQQLGLAVSVGTSWTVNPAFDGSLGLELLRLNVNSVLFEELIFRGYLLLLAIRYLGTRRAVVADAVLFGIYHWFSYGVVGDPVSMFFVFILTASAGVMFATAFAATGSVIAPISLHLGWNLTSYGVFSGGPWGPGLLLPSDGSVPLQADGATGLLLSLVLPIGFAVGTTLFLRRLTPLDASLRGRVEQELP